MAATASRNIRPAISDRWGLAWEPEELPDMTMTDALEIIRLDEEAHAAGSIGNEDPSTIAHAKKLLAEAGDL